MAPIAGVTLLWYLAVCLDVENLNTKGRPFISWAASFLFGAYTKDVSVHGYEQGELILCTVTQNETIASAPFSVTV